MKVSLDSIITSSELSWKGSIRQLSSSKTFCQTAWNSFLLPASSSTGPSFLLASLYLFPFFPEWGQSFATSGYNALQNTLRVESGLVVINYQPPTESAESWIWTGHRNLPLNELRIVFELVVINSHESNAKLKPDQPYFTPCCRRISVYPFIGYSQAGHHNALQSFFYMKLTSWWQQDLFRAHQVPTHKSIPECYLRHKLAVFTIENKNLSLFGSQIWMLK